MVPTIDMMRSVHWRGVGDTVGLAWLAEATRNERDPLSFYADRGSKYDTVLRLMCQEVTDDPGAPDLWLIPDSYGPEIRDGAKKLRLDYLRDQWGLKTGIARPKVRIPEDSLEWAARVVKEYGGRPVLLFPQTDWAVRQWPTCYWVDLAWQLNNRGIPSLILLGHDEKQYENTPRRIWGHSFNHVAALMSMSSLVVGNDSGPAHLSGTIGMPTIALLGFTRGECVFGHLPEVIQLASDEPPGCAGCHCGHPYRAACDIACQSLHTLWPHVVLARILLELDR